MKTAVIGLIAALVAGCQTLEASKLAAEEGASGGSVCELQAQWETDSGQKIRLSDLKGSVHVISMFYATCQGVCVITKRDMQEIEASLSPTARQHIGFVLATLDPERDTLSALRSYRHAENLSPARWTLLRGDHAATAKLAALLGVAYKRDASGRYIHSSELVVLDESGRIIHRHSGLRANLSAITKEIESAARPKTKGS